METARSGRLLAGRGRAGSSILFVEADLTSVAKPFANQNTAINVLPFEGSYAFITSILYPFLCGFCQRVCNSLGGCGASICDCRCANRLHFGGTRAEKETSSRQSDEDRHCQCRT